MNTHSLLCQHCLFPIRGRAAVMLVMMATLILSSPAFCGEIHDAARGGDLAKVRALLKNNPDLVFSKDDYGYTPLHWAVVMRHKDVAELLLANKADVNAKETITGATPLHLAEQKDVVELLLANKADVNAKADGGVTPLHEAAAGGYRDVVELLLANKADVNSEADGGVTPLHLAVVKGHKDVAELLRQHFGHE